MDSIIFDVDGTLWDSTENRSKILGATISTTEEHMDRTLTAETSSASMFGQPLPDIAQTAFS